MQEEVENKTVNLVISTSKLSGRILLDGLKKYLEHRSKAKAAAKADKGDTKPMGKQSIKELIGQNQGVTSIDIAKTDLRGFERYARKFGVDYSIVKEKGPGPQKYLCFFKAKDADALTAAFNAYTAKALSKGSRPSVRKLLAKMKAITAAPGKTERKKQKERTQTR